MFDTVRKYQIFDNDESRSTTHNIYEILIILKRDSAIKLNIIGSEIFIDDIVVTSRWSIHVLIFIRNIQFMNWQFR